MTVITFYLF